jgi:hypothetical protein
MKASAPELEKSIESCERWEWYGGGLVVVGLIADVAIAAIHPPYNSFWEQWGSSIASGLIAIGVVAEIKFGQMAGLRQHELKRRSDKKVAEAQRKSANANARAGNSEALAALAQARAAEAQLELAKFKAARILSAEQQTRISEKLKPFAGAKYDAGIGPMGDPEPLYLLRSIHSALSAAGWEQVAWTGGGATYTEAPILDVGLTMVTNVMVDVHPKYWAQLGTAASALADALNAEGIAATEDSKPTTIHTEMIHLRIGRKL